MRDFPILLRLFGPYASLNVDAIVQRVLAWKAWWLNAGATRLNACPDAQESLQNIRPAKGE
jgi:hypothetical protein